MEKIKQQMKNAEKQKEKSEEIEQALVSRDVPQGKLLGLAE